MSFPSINRVLPQQLKVDSLRFIKLRPNEKIPVEKTWSTVNNYKYYDKSFVEHLNKGGNYGVVGGYGNLVILDFDDESTYMQLQHILPQTFTVRSAKRKLPHLYYFTEEPMEKSCVDKEKRENGHLVYSNGRKSMVRIIDVVGIGGQVVGPNSKIDTRTYEVVNDVPIATITQELIKRIQTLYKPPMITKPAIQPPQKKSMVEISNDVQEIKNKISLSRVYSDLGGNCRQMPSNCVLGHDSVGNKCFSINGKLWYCFHCQQGGDVFSLIQRAKNMSFGEAIDYLRKNY